MEWVLILAFLVKTIGPAVATGVLSSQLTELFSKLRRMARGQEELSADLVREMVEDALPGEVCEQVEWAWLHSLYAEKNTELILDELGEMSDRVVELHNRADIDRDVAQALTNRMHELLRLLRTVVQDSEEQLEILNEIRSRFLPPRFTVVRDVDTDSGREEVRKALDLWEPDRFLSHPLERREVLDAFPERQNVLVTGLPGAGKTTAIYQRLLTLLEKGTGAVVVVEGGFGAYADHPGELLRSIQVEGLPADFTIVFDDIQGYPEDFVRGAREIQHSYPDSRLIGACRTPDLDRLRRQAIPGFRESLDLKRDVDVGPLTETEAGQIVDLCQEAWGVEVDDQLRDWLVERGNRRCATPFYFVSILAPLRGEEDSKARLADLLALPEEDRESIHAIWREYFKELPEVHKNVLRTARMLNEMELPCDETMLSFVGGGVFNLSNSDITESVGALEDRLWLSWSEGEFTLYDVQSAAINLKDRRYEKLCNWILGLGGTDSRTLILMNQAGLMQRNRSRKEKDGTDRYEALQMAAKLWLSGADAVKSGGEQRRQAILLTNVSNCFAELASLAPDEETRHSWLEKGLASIQETIGICRRHHLANQLALGLNNAACLYSDLSESAPTEAKKQELLSRALGAINEAITIRSECGPLAGLAMSLSNAAAFKAHLAELTSDGTVHRELLQEATDAAENAVQIYRKLGLPDDLARSLNIVANRYADLSQCADSECRRRELLGQATCAIDEAMQIHRRLSLPVDLAISLNNASGHYARLAGTLPDTEKEQLMLPAVGFIEEAIEIRRRMNCSADLAASLNNASIRYSTLAQLSSDAQERRRLLRDAVVAIEEAVAIFRKLGHWGSLASILSNASGCYLAWANAVSQDAQRRKMMANATETITEAIDIQRKLNLPVELAHSLGKAALVWNDKAEQERAEKHECECYQQAAVYVDESIDILQGLNHVYCLSEIYQRAIMVWQELEETDREKSRRKVVEYARNAVPLLRDCGEDSQADEFKELLERMSEDEQ